MSIKAITNKKKRKSTIQGLSSLEANIMSVVWRNKKLTVRDVHEVLLKDDYIPYTTIMAAMNNMSQKGLLKQNKNGKAYMYSAALSNVDMANQIVDYIVDKVLNGSKTAILCHLLKIKDKEEVERIVELREKLYS